VNRLGAAALLAAACGLLSGCPTTEPEPGEPVDERSEWGTQSLPATQCVGDGDGVVAGSELVVAPGLAPTSAFLVDPASDPVDLPGTRFELDFAAAPDDEVLWLGPSLMDGAWFADAFTDAEFHALTDVGGATRSVYRREGDALLLLGIASVEQGETILVYDPPVPVLPLPLALGDAWTVEADALGHHDGQDYPADLGPSGVVTLIHRYEFEVVEAGDVALPAADLPALVLRLRLVTEAHNSYLGLVAAESVRVDLVVAECLGVVARIRSHADELDADFVHAAEVMRLGFEPELLP
jgi:hypothetical protein